MTKRTKRRPIIGPAFDADQRNEPERIAAYVAELRHYRPRGFSKLAREGEKIERQMWRDADSERTDAWDHADSFKQECEDLLTEWARRIEGHDYISFGPFDYSGDVGFYINADGVTEDADLCLDAGDDVPRGFSGLAVFVTDHGNVTAQRFARGRMVRELFSVV